MIAAALPVIAYSQDNAVVLSEEQLQVTDNRSDSMFYITDDGQVVIGKVPVIGSHAYRLYVGKGILTEKLRVAFSGDSLNWADYVFEEDYELPNLKELEKYIKVNKHLPDVPPAEDVYKNGIDVAEMNALLLKKVEELTLYIIEQQKQIDELKAATNEP